MLPAEFIKSLQNLIPSDRLYFDPVDCYAYAYDNSRKFFPPECVIFPLTTDETAKTVRLCNQFKIPLTPRGRGTGTAGGSLAEQGGATLSLEQMTQIISIDPPNRALVTSWLFLATRPFQCGILNYWRESCHQRRRTTCGQIWNNPRSCAWIDRSNRERGHY